MSSVATLRRAQGSRTATGKEQALQNFYDQLARDEADRPALFAGTVTQLAFRAGVGRCHLARILSGKCVGRQSGRHTWKHVLPHLSFQALCALAQCSAWNIHAMRALQARAWLEYQTYEVKTVFGEVRIFPPSPYFSNP